eukprot:CAMPEP_0113528356 /NCGR_PEP_ID=MMETSP0015_2-20120614/1797_1 /TAXON_ID=2838 /ORGANISM="Odontella" /LENGTH=480 /DNA_ID=CAMNT_0000426875 /DNA_START=157 /DNA_END=1595 /DNA_ORIENTATION=+ /assembly_acc=CAM_ASM_000160
MASFKRRRRSRQQQATEKRQKLFPSLFLLIFVFYASSHIFSRPTSDDSSHASWAMRNNQSVTRTAVVVSSKKYPQTVSLNGEQPTKAAVLFQLQPNGYERRIAFVTEEELSYDEWDKYETDDCKYEEWQKQTHPSCNLVHEFSAAANQYNLLAMGGESVIFSLQNVDEIRRKEAVLKTGIWKRTHFDSPDYYRRQIDTTIMEHLTSSPYVMSLYGFCATSVLSPRASNDLYGLINSVRNGGEEPAPLDKLRIIIQLAEGVAAMHEAGVAHNDLDTSQHLFYDGRFHINDFTYGFLQRRNPKTKIPCKATKSDFSIDPWKYKAPEYLAWAYPEMDAEPIRMDLAEVYSLGAEIYHLLTNSLWWEGSTDKALSKRLIFEGKRPPIPKAISDSNDEATKAIMHALNECWRHNPFERPVAKEVAKYLRKELNRIANVDDEKNADAVVRVKLPPLVEAKPNEEICYYRYMSLPGRGDKGPGCDPP